MDYVKFGKTGLDVSRLCVGCMTYGIADRGAHSWTLDDADRAAIAALPKNQRFVNPGFGPKWD